MSRRTFFWASVFVSLGATVPAVYFRSRSHAVAAEHAARVAVLQEKIERAAPFLRPPGQRAALRRPKTFAALEAELRNVAAEKSLRWEKALAEDVGLRVLEERAQRASWSARFAALFKQKGFTTEQREAFLDALIKSTTQPKELRAVAQQKGLAVKVAQQKGLAVNSPEIQALKRQMDAEVLSAMTALLGPDPYAQTRVFDQLSDARTYVASYAALWTRVGEPVAPQQLDALAAVIADLDPGRADPAKLTSAQWDEFSRRARAILTPSQAEILDTATPPGARGPQEQRLDELLAQIAGPTPRS